MNKGFISNNTNHEYIQLELLYTTVSQCCTVGEKESHSKNSFKMIHLKTTICEYLKYVQVSIFKRIIFENKTHQTKAG